MEARKIEPASVRIDPEFEAAMFPLSSDEYAQLEANILAEGCLDPVKVWRGILVDGHNRFKICTGHGLPFSSVDLMLADRDAVLDWIDKNQLGRRNLTPDQMRLIRGRRYNREKKAPHRPEKGAQNDPLIEPEKTAERHARDAGVSPATIKRDAAAVAAIEPRPDLTAAVQSGALPLSVAAQATGLPVDTVAEALAAPEPAKIIKAHVANNSGNNEWYTPAEFIEAAREVMGSIDCDPATSEFANRTVQATTFYTAETNGLEQAWSGNVWMNPPYSGDLIGRFAESVTTKYAEGEINQAIVLVNNATETAWFQRMMQEATAICFPKGRIKYLDHTGNPANTPLQGQAFIYFGEDFIEFGRVFSRFGITVWLCEFP